jgi:hypothetical protein
MAVIINEFEVLVEDRKPASKFSGIPIGRIGNQPPPPKPGGATLTPRDIGDVVRQQAERNARLATW